MIINLFIAFATAQAVLGSYMIGRLLARKMAEKTEEKDDAMDLVFTGLILALFYLFILNVDSRFDGDVPAEAAKRSAIIASVLFAVLSLSSASLLTHYASKIERKRNIRLWLKFVVSVALTVWLAMATASIGGFTKSAFFASGAARYSVKDGGYGYLNIWKVESLDKIENSMSACQNAIVSIGAIKSPLTFRRQVESSSIAGSHSKVDFLAYADGTIFSPLKVTRYVRAARRGPAQAIEKVRFQTPEFGTCEGSARRFDFHEGISIEPRTLTIFFGRLLRNVKENAAQGEANKLPWYALGANQALSEINVNILQVAPSNKLASVLDNILFWMSKILLVYILAFFVTRIKRDIGSK